MKNKKQFLNLGAVILIVTTHQCLGAGENTTAASTTTWVNAINFSSPQKLSYSTGIVIASSDNPFYYTIHGPVGRGALIQIEPGLSGGKFGFGYANLGGLAGYSLKALVLRTWSEPWSPLNNATYIGAEGSIYIFGFRAAVGPLYSVSSNNSRNRWPLLVGIGVGF